MSFNESFQSKLINRQIVMINKKSNDNSHANIK